MYLANSQIYNLQGGCWMDGAHFQTAEVLTSEMEIGRCVHKLAECSMLQGPEKIPVEGKMWQLEGWAEAISGSTSRMLQTRCERLRRCGQSLHTHHKYLSVVYGHADLQALRQACSAQ